MLLVLHNKEWGMPVHLYIRNTECVCIVIGYFLRSKADKILVRIGVVEGFMPILLEFY